MTLEVVIVNNAKIKEAKLLNAAQKAVSAPETGITVQHPAALNVIRDCAICTVQYIPFLCLSSYADVFTALKGKVDISMVQDFTARAQSDAVTNQLLKLLLDKCPTTPQEAIIPTSEADDAYGEYERYTDVAPKIKMVDSTFRLAKAFNLVS